MIVVSICSAPTISHALNMDEYQNNDDLQSKVASVIDVNKTLISKPHATHDDDDRSAERI